MLQWCHVPAQTDLSITHLPYISCTLGLLVVRLRFPCSSSFTVLILKVADQTSSVLDLQPLLEADILTSAAFITLEDHHGLHLSLSKSRHIANAWHLSDIRRENTSVALTSWHSFR